MPSSQVPWAPTIVRRYRGFRQVDAMRRYQRDAALLAGQGFVPIRHRWASGRWGCTAFSVAIILCLVGVGFFVLLFLLLTKPEGTLLVTYRYQSSALSDSPASATLTSRIQELDAALQAGLITDAEHQAKRAEILAGH